MDNQSFKFDNGDDERTHLNSSVNKTPILIILIEKFTRKVQNTKNNHLFMKPDIWDKQKNVLI